MARNQDYILSTSDKLLRRFYEPLILLGTLDPTRGRRCPDLKDRNGLQEPEKLWRDFLDQLSLVCDAEKGGNTVTAIAAEATAENTIFWLASNSTAGNKAKCHVEWILSQLSGICDADVDLQSVIQLITDEITGECIRFCSSRIKTYTHFLVKHIKNLRDHGSGEADEDRQLLEALQPFDTLKTSDARVCAYAYSLRDTHIMQILHKRHISHERYGMWSDIRHIIGRLGCWIKAAKVLVQGAIVFPQYVGDAKVNLVLPRDLPNVLPSRSQPDLEGIIKRMAAKDETAAVVELVQSLQELDRISPWSDRFLNAFTTLQPRPHAELLVLEHFYENNSDFVQNDRYIGCSKPSCYCCRLYMKVHPGRFEERDCHGNLWRNWSPPIPLPITQPLKKDGKKIERSQEHLTFKLLQDMIPYVRADLKEQIRSRRPRKNRIPDTSTGMSSIILGRGQANMRPHPSREVAHREPVESIDQAGRTIELKKPIILDLVAEPLMLIKDSLAYGTAITHTLTLAHPEPNTGNTARCTVSNTNTNPHRQAKDEVDSEDDDDSDILMFVGRRFRCLSLPNV